MFFNIILSFFLIFEGIIIILTGELSTREGINFNIESVKWSSGLIMISFGLIILYLTIQDIIKKFKGKSVSKENKPLICPVCLNNYYRDKIKNLECPKCKVSLLKPKEFLESDKIQNDKPL